MPPAPNSLPPRKSGWPWKSAGKPSKRAADGTSALSCGYLQTLILLEIAGVIHRSPTIYSQAFDAPVTKPASAPLAGPGVREQPDFAERECSAGGRKNRQRWIQKQRRAGGFSEARTGATRNRLPGDTEATENQRGDPRTEVAS